MPFASTEFRYRKLEHIFFKFYSKHITLCDVEYFGNIYDPSPSPELASHFYVEWNLSLWKKECYFNQILTLD